MDTDFPARIKKLKDNISKAANKANRDPNEIKILAVSKGQNSNAIRNLFSLGQVRFGENYLQEALKKKSELADLKIEWHFIGAIQSNKTRELAQSFDFVHSVDRIKIASRLNEQREGKKKPLNILIQIKDENSKKNGMTLHESYEFIQAVQKFENLKLKGLMYFPDPGKSDHEYVAAYRQIANLLTLVKNGDTLSMGTSSDYPLAILSGATLIRIGTELFGARNKK